MLRIVQPEILDSLPHDDLEAIHSRQDLSRINQLMGNTRWLKRVLLLDKDQSHDFLEIGAGDGRLGKTLLKAMQVNSYTALDIAPKPSAWPQSARWVESDLLTYDGYDEASHLIANLILHHFEFTALKQLGQRITQSSIHTIVACEPCRRAFHKVQVKAGRLIGFNRVTLHDATVSVEAGFRGNELPELLGLSASEWDCSIQETFMGAYRMRATRR